MPTNLALDDRLIEQAQKLGGHRTKKMQLKGPLTSTSGIVNSESSWLYSAKSSRTATTTTNGSAGASASERVSGYSPPIQISPNYALVLPLNLHKPRAFENSAI